MSRKFTANFRLDHPAKIGGLKVEANEWYELDTTRDHASAKSSVTSYLVQNSVVICDARCSRIEATVVDENDILIEKMTFRIEDLLQAELESLGWSEDSESIQDRVKGLWDGKELNPEQTKFLTGLYKDYQRAGDAIFDGNSDLFGEKSRTRQDIYDRFWKFPKSKDRDFLKEVSEGDQETIQEVLFPSSHSGYAVDFAYELFEKYFMDSVDIQLDAEELEEHELTEDEDEVTFLARAAGADGAQEYIFKAAKDWLENEAQEWLSENPEDEEETA